MRSTHKRHALRISGSKLYTLRQRCNRNELCTDIKKDISRILCKLYEYTQRKDSVFMFRLCAKSRKKKFNPPNLVGKYFYYF